MAVGTAKLEIAPQHREGVVYPSTFFSPWSICCTAVDAADSNPHKPGLITRAAQRLIELTGKGTLLEICMAYDDGITVSVQLIVNAYGRDRNGVWQQLKDKDDNTDFTLTATPASDAQGKTIAGAVDPSGNSDTVAWAGYQFTPSTTVDTNGNTHILLPVKTALAVSGGDATLSRLMARIK